MRILLFLSCLVIVACQALPSNKPATSTEHPSIKEANQLGMGSQKFTYYFPPWYNEGFSGVLLKIPSGKLAIEGEDSLVVNSFYIDATEVCNLHYRSFLDWNQRILMTMPQVYYSLLPDTSVWLEKFPNQAIGGRLKDHYFRNPAFDYYPVVGVSWEQAQAYALWRTDRINEAILTNRKHIAPDFEGQQGDHHFNSYNYLRGSYEATPGDKPIVDKTTKEERRVSKEDDVLLPYCRLPLPTELDYAQTQTQPYNTHKALKAFKKKILAHSKKYPEPAFYDHQQYDLPYSIIDPEQLAPYYLQNSTAEWTQQHDSTQQQYKKIHDDRLTNKEPYHIYREIWITRSFENIRDTINWSGIKWLDRMRQEYRLNADSSLIQPFHQQHQPTQKDIIVGFRCVLPNWWQNKNQ